MKSEVDHFLLSNRKRTDGSAQQNRQIEIWRFKFIRARLICIIRLDLFFATIHRSPVGQAPS
jgi:hypothetical protein